MTDTTFNAGASQELDVIVWGCHGRARPRVSAARPYSGRDDRHWCLAMGHGFFYGNGGSGRRRYSPTNCVTPAEATSPSVTTMSRPTSGRAGWRLILREPR